MQNTSEVYKMLYHYTNWGGLHGILQTNTLWATHGRFLNDSSEMMFARDELISRTLPYTREEYEKIARQLPDIKQRIEHEGGMERIVRHDTEAFIDAHYKATGSEIFIASFCAHDGHYISKNGLLSQWRGYGDGGGFAIVFNTRRLEEMLDTEARRFAYAQMHLSDVVYSDDEDKLEHELSKDLSIIAHSIADFFRVVTSGRVTEECNTCLLENYEPFFRCITRLKHCGFSEEKEIRMAALRTIPGQKSLEPDGRDDVAPRPEKEVKIRSRNMQIVPYIELFSSANMKLPIERIIVGPHREKEARTEALRLMLSDTGIEVTPSEIPLV